jgi:hypothetical protein
MQSMVPARREPSCDRRRGAGEIAADLCGRAEAVTLVQSLLAVSPLQLLQGRNPFREGDEGSDTEQVFFQAGKWCRFKQE